MKEIRNKESTEEVLDLIDQAVAGLNFKLLSVLECYFRLRLKYH
jgi:hypothetical protein